MNRIYFVILILLLSCSKEEESIRPIVSDITVSVYASGKIEASNQYNVFSTVSGIVDEIFYSEGEPIKSGDVILSIKNMTQSLNKENARLSKVYADKSNNLNRLEEAESKLNLAKNVMENDSIMYLRQKGLWSKSVGSKVELEKAELSYKNSKNNYVSALEMYDQVKRQVDLNSKQSLNNYKIAEEMLDDYNIKSLIDGRLYSLNVKKGELVTQQKMIGTIGSSDDFILKLQVDEKDIKDIRIGQEVMVELNSHLDQIFEAKVTKINPLMNEQTKTFEIEAEFIKSPDNLYPNVSFEANIVINSKSNTLLLPLEYVSGDSVKLKDGTYKKIELGLRDYKMIEVLSGINETTELVKP